MKKLKVTSRRGLVGVLIMESFRGGLRSQMATVMMSASRGLVEFYNGSDDWKAVKPGLVQSTVISWSVQIPANQ